MNYALIHQRTDLACKHGHDHNYLKQDAECSQLHVHRDLGFFCLSLQNLTSLGHYSHIVLVNITSISKHGDGSTPSSALDCKHTTGTTRRNNDWFERYWKDVSVVCGEWVGHAQSSTTPLTPTTEYTYRDETTPLAGLELPRMLHNHLAEVTSTCHTYTHMAIVVVCFVSVTVSLSPLPIQ